MLQGADARDPLAAKKPDHPPTAKSVIWLFMEGGPSHIDIFDPEARAEAARGAAAAAIVRQSDHRDGHGVEYADAVAAHVEAVRAERHVGLRLVSEDRGACGRPDDVPLLLGGRVESRGLGLPDEYRVDSGGPAVDGRVGDVRAGRGQRQSADLRDSDGRGRSGGRHEELEFGIPAGELSGHAVPARGRADSRSGAADDDRRASSSAAGWIC